MSRRQRHPHRNRAVAVRLPSHRHLENCRHLHPSCQTRPHSRSARWSRQVAASRRPKNHRSCRILDQSCRILDQSCSILRWNRSGCRQADWAEQAYRRPVAMAYHHPEEPACRHSADWVHRRWTMTIVLCTHL